jgi:hypothetical protein
MHGAIATLGTSRLDYLQQPLTNAYAAIAGNYRTDSDAANRSALESEHHQGGAESRETSARDARVLLS